MTVMIPVSERGHRLHQQVKDIPLHRPSQLLRKGLKLAPRAVGEANLPISHRFPTPRQDLRG
jgi:hypothetical protein